MPRPIQLRLAAFVTLGLVCAPVRGQAVQTLTLDEIVRRAATEGTAARAAGLAVREHTAGVKAARAAYLPEASAYVQGAQRYGLAFDQTVGRLTQAGNQAASMGAEVSYPLYDGLARAAALARTRADLAGAELMAVYARQQAVSDALRAAYTLAAADAAVALADAQVQAARAQAGLVDAQVRAGRRPPTERLQADERLATAELAALDARRVQQGALMALVRLLALDPALPYRFAPPAPDTSAFPAPEAAAALVAEAMSRRADLRALEAATHASVAQQRAVRAGVLPSVALVGGYGTSFTSTGAGAFGTQLGQNRGGSVGLRVGIPLLSRWRTRADAEAAEARTARVRLDAEDRRRAVETEVRGALADGRVLVQTLGATRRRVAAAAAALAAETARYGAGAIPLADLAEVQARHADALAARERARLDLAFQHALLAFLTGTP